MKKKNILLTTAIIFIVLLFIYNTYNSLILNYYTTENFTVDYNKKWTAIEKNKNYIALKNNNNSTIQISSKIIEDNTKNIDDIYFDFEEDFKNNNKNFELINYSNTKVGKDYLDGYTYLYDYKGFQILLVLIKKENKMIEITYSTINQYFDIELEDFYNVLNSLEINNR